MQFSTAITIPLAIASLSILGFTSPLQAQLSNLGQTSSAAGNVTADPGNGVHNLGQSFITGSGPGIDGWSLSSITISMYFANEDTAPPFTLAIYQDSLDTPGGLLATLVGDSNPQLSGDYTYNVADDLILEAGTQYWIVASAVDSTAPGSAFYWSIIDGNGTNFITQSQGWTVNTDVAIGTYDGSGWSVFTAGDNGGNFAFSFDAAVVPEPGTSILCLAAAIILGPLLRRRMRRE